VIDKVGIYSILEVSPTVVWQENVDRLTAWIGFVSGRGNAVVNRSNDVGMWIEESISFNFFEC
jgi:hypothetical protein